MQVLTLLLLLDCILQQWWFLVLVLVHHYLDSSYPFPCFAVSCVSKLIRGDKRQKVSMACLQVGGNKGYFPWAPKLLRGPMRLLFSWFYLYGLHFHVYLSLSRHCLDSMSERLGRIISNAFTVSVDKLFDACKHLEPTPLINWPHLYN